MEKIKKHLTVKVPAKASIWYIASSAIARSVGVLGTPIFTRLLTPLEYGLYPLYNTWLGIATVLLTLELTGGAIYRGLQKHYGSSDDFISSSFGLFLVVFLTFSAIYFPFSGFINRLTGLNTFITSMMLTQIFACTVIAFYSAKARYEYRYKSVALLNIFTALGIPLLSSAVIILTRYRGEGRIIGSSAVYLLISLPILYNLIRSSRKIYDKETWRYLLRSALPLLPHYLSMSLILRIGEITVGKYFGTDALGRYSVALSLGMSLTVVTNGLISALSPWILRKIRADNIEEIRNLLLLLTKGLSLLSLVVLTFSPEVIKILTPPDYHSALPAVYPLLISVVPMFLSNAIMSGELYYEKNGISAFPSIISAVFSVLLTLIILPITDYRIVGIFVYLSYVLLVFLCSLIFKRLSGKAPVHIKGTVMTLLLCSFYALLLFMFRDFLASRIVLLLPLLPMLYIFGKDALKKIRE